MSSIVSTETEPVCVLSNDASAFRAASQEQALMPGFSAERSDDATAV